MEHCTRARSSMSDSQNRPAGHNATTLPSVQSLLNTQHELNARRHALPYGKQRGRPMDNHTVEDLWITQGKSQHIARSLYRPCLVLGWSVTGGGYLFPLQCSCYRLRYICTKQDGADMTRKHTKPGHMRDNCPKCSPNGSAGFTADWNRDSDGPSAPVWACNNCGHELPRIVRAKTSKRCAALAALRAASR